MIRPLLHAVLAMLTGITYLATPVVDSPVRTEAAPGFYGRSTMKSVPCATADGCLFGSVVQWLKAGGLTKSKEAVDLPLRIDPRPLRTDLDKSGGIMALDLLESDFAEVDSSALRRRRATLRRLEVPQRKAMPYYENCLMTGGLHLVTDSTYTGPPDQCKFMVVAVSLSRPVSAIPEKGNCRDCRVVQFVTLSPSSFQVYKLYAQRRSGGQGWKVIGVENVNGIMS